MKGILNNITKSSSTTPKNAMNNSPAPTPRKK